MSKSFQVWDHFFPLLFPKDSLNLKCLDIELREGGGQMTVKRCVKQWVPKKSCSVRQHLPKNILFLCAKIRLKNNSKVNTQTDTQTDIQTHTHMKKSTYRKHQPRGPMLLKPVLVNAYYWDFFSLLFVLSFLIVLWL